MDLSFWSWFFISRNFVIGFNQRKQQERQKKGKTMRKRGIEEISIKECERDGGSVAQWLA